MSARLAASIGLGFVALLQTSDAAARRAYESPQRFAFEIKAGPYWPNIDDEPGLGDPNGSNTPYRDLFGRGPGTMIQTELDVQLWGGFGSIGIGGSIGFFFDSASSFRDDVEPGAEGPAAVASSNKENRLKSDKTKLQLVPLALLAVYRFDVLADRWDIPLVPYFKIGPTYTLWWMQPGKRDEAANRGRGRGGVWGLQINAGLAIQLDVFEPSAAKVLDGDVGINHSYLFVELHHVDAWRAPEVGTTAFLAGLALEF